MTQQNLKRMANAVRVLSVDAVERAKSGHPGLPLGMADVATVLYAKFMKFDPRHPDWPDRDRFILSAGHGSMLLYSILHLTGYSGMTLEQIKNFRQLHSLTPGHPEVDLTPGIETTTGPLAQGLGNAVGMAMAERILNARWSDKIVDHYTYCIVGDGCLMEGLSHEAISIAGHHQLNKLIVFWDNNHISIDGSTSLSVSDDYTKRFEGHRWHIESINGHDYTEIEKAIQKAKQDPRPSIIFCDTKIGFGAPTKEGTAACHGAPLGEEEVIGLKRNLGWSLTPFHIPDEVYSDWLKTSRFGIEERIKWYQRFNDLSTQKQDEFNRTLKGNLIKGWEKPLIDYKRKLAEDTPIWATRKASGEALTILASEFPELIGGSADLTESVNTKTKEMQPISKDKWDGRYIHWGIREHGMAAAMNGMALHGGVIPYSGTFLSFVDYMRPSVRLASIMKKRVIFVLTHDSIGVGEDGPTHQPTEILAGLRIIPNLKVYRPCDAIETFECWLLAIDDRDHPSALILTRQAVPPVRLEHTDENLCARGAYVLKEADNNERDVTIFATGSEVSVALRARKILWNEGIQAAVVSMPCWEIFDQQTQEYKDSVLGGDSIRVAVEAAISPTWDRYIGTNGVFVGLTDFGLSGPGPILFEYFGITAEKVAEAARAKLKEKRENLSVLSKMLYTGRV